VLLADNAASPGKENAVDIRVDFASIPWQAQVPGQRYKVAESDDKRVRLVEFVEGFEEGGWCTVGHAGLVLEGALTLEIRDPRVPEGASRTRLSQGDTMLIPAGDEHAHRAVLGAGERALLLLVETVGDEVPAAD
jgi:hypothetical protein